MACIYPRFPGGLDRALTMSYDDGVETDRRLIDIMRAHGLKGTFNINAGCFAPEGTVYPEGTVHRRMSKSDCVAVYRDSGMEVALHGYRHAWLTQLPKTEMLEEIAHDRRDLETLFGTLVRGGAYAFGAYNASALETLRACGIVYCRTCNSTHAFGIPEDWLTLAPTCHHDDPRLFELVDRFLAAPSFGAPQLFYLWGHSYEFDGKNNWQRMEEFAEKTGGRDNVWYATNIEVYDYMEAYHRLRFSLDGTRVCNPSCLSVFFSVEGKIHCVAPGETLIISV